MERDDEIVLMQCNVDDYRGEVGHLRNQLRELTEDIWDLRNRRVRRPVKVIDLTGDDEVEEVAGPTVWVEREDTIVPLSPSATLVEIEEPVEDGRSTPQIVGEAERAFERMEREGSVEQDAGEGIEGLASGLKQK